MSSSFITIYYYYVNLNFDSKIFYIYRMLMNSTNQFRRVLIGIKRMKKLFRFSNNDSKCYLNRFVMLINILLLIFPTVKFMWKGLLCTSRSFELLRHCHMVYSLKNSVCKNVGCALEIRFLSVLFYLLRSRYFFLRRQWDETERGGRLSPSSHSGGSERFVAPPSIDR